MFTTQHQRRLHLQLACLTLAFITAFCVLLLRTHATPANQHIPPPPINDSETNAKNAAASLTTDETKRAQLKEKFKQLQVPLSFEANQGQTADEVKFLARGHGYNLFLTDTEAVLAWDESQAIAKKSKKVSSGALRMKFIGANSSVPPEGIEELSGKSNYLLGADPAKWRTNVPTYAKVLYRDAYPGVDIIYYGTGQQLEYDLVVAPGVDPNRIKIEIEGGGHLRLNKQGDLVIGGKGKNVHLGVPVIYPQMEDGRHAIGGGYVIRGKNEIGFHLAAYDKTKPLVIDPTLIYSTYLSGSDSSFVRINGVAVDPARSAYVVGRTTSVAFPTRNPFQALLGNGHQRPDISSDRGEDAFVSKLSPDGSSLIYSTYLGGSFDDTGLAIAVDAAGEAFVTGLTDSTDFPVMNAFQGNYGGGQSDFFVCKLNSTGSALLFSTYFGGNGAEGPIGNVTNSFAYDTGMGMAIDAQQNVYITSNSISFNFPTTPGVLQPGRCCPSATTASYPIVSKFSPSGTLLYSTFFGGQSATVPNAIAVDDAGNTYLTGYANPGFPVTAGAFQTTSHGSTAFIAKVNPTASALVYATYLGSTSFGNSYFSSGEGIAVDSSGDAYVAGSTGPDFPIMNPAQPAFRGRQQNGFVTKLNPTGTGLVFSTYLGGSGDEQNHSIALDAAGNAYVAGDTVSQDFPTLFPIQARNGSNNWDVTLTQFSPAGLLLFSTYLGGSGADYSVATAVDTSDNMYVAGHTNSQNFPTSRSAFQTLSSGTASSRGAPEESFISKIYIPSGFSLQGVQPDKGADTGPITTLVRGRGFVQGATVKLVRAGQPDIIPDSIQFVGESLLRVIFDLTGKVQGLYDVILTNPDNTAKTLTGAFTVEQKRQGNLSIDVIARSVIRIGNEYPFYILYGYSGNTDITDAPLWVGVPNYVSIVPDTNLPFEVVPIGNKTYIEVTVPRVRAGSVQSPDVLAVKVKVADPNDFHRLFRTKAVIFNPQFDPQSASAATSASQNSFIETAHSGIRALDLTVQQCKDALDDHSGPLLGDFVFNHGRTYIECLELLDPTGDGYPSYPSHTPEGDRAAYNNSFSRKTDPRNPNDPNEKDGPGGVGAQGYITGKTALPYAIYFENKDTAALPAQDVVVTDQLDPAKVDLSTFSFGVIAFGNRHFIPPAGQTSSTSYVDLRPDKNVVVKVTANLDSNTGLVSWKFNSLDPATLQTPLDPLAGFLPPNKTSPEGQGAVTFTVMPKVGIQTGTFIFNKARIVFDVNAPIDTPTVINAIDNTAPVSVVQALPARVSSSFIVNWSGTDDDGEGSGVGSYTIYVSDNGGVFTPFVINTSAANGIFTGQIGHTYGFYSIAVDAVGNVEPAKTTAAATTTVVPVVSVSGRVVAPDGRGLRNTTVSITDPNGVRRTATTSSFGFYQFDNVLIGGQYTIAVNSRLYRFAPRTLPITDTLTNVDFVGLE